MAENYWGWWLDYRTTNGQIQKQIWDFYNSQPKEYQSENKITEADVSKFVLEGLNHPGFDYGNLEMEHPEWGLVKLFKEGRSAVSGEEIIWFLQNRDSKEFNDYFEDGKQKQGRISFEGLSRAAANVAYDYLIQEYGAIFYICPESGNYLELILPEDSEGVDNLFEDADSPHGKICTPERQDPQHCAVRSVRLGGGVDSLDYVGVGFYTLNPTVTGLQKGLTVDKSDSAACDEKKCLVHVSVPNDKTERHTGYLLSPIQTHYGIKKDYKDADPESEAWKVFKSPEVQAAASPIIRHFGKLATLVARDMTKYAIEYGKREKMALFPAYRSWKCLTPDQIKADIERSKEIVRLDDLDKGELERKKELKKGAFAKAQVIGKYGRQLQELRTAPAVDDRLIETYIRDTKHGLAKFAASTKVQKMYKQMMRDVKRDWPSAKKKLQIAGVSKEDIKILENYLMNIPSPKELYPADECRRLANLWHKWSTFSDGKEMSIQPYYETKEDAAKFKYQTNNYQAFLLYLGNAFMHPNFNYRSITSNSGDFYLGRAIIENIGFMKNNPLWEGFVFSTKVRRDVLKQSKRPSIMEPKLK